MRKWPTVEVHPESILLADKDLVALDKESGVLCDASVDPNREHLGTALRRWANNDNAEFLPAH